MHTESEIEAVMPYIEDLLSEFLWASTIAERMERDGVRGFDEAHVRGILPTALLAVAEKRSETTNKEKQS